MSKRWYLLIPFLSIFGAVFLISLTSPGDSYVPSGETDGEKTRIICFLSGASGMDQINHEIAQGLSDGAEQYEEAAVSIYSFDDFEDRNFVGGVETFLAMQGDIMVAFGTNDAGDAADLVADNQVKVILLDTDTPENPEERIAFIGTDNQGVIQQVIQSVKENIPEANAAVFITHQHSTTFLRRDEVTELANHDPALQIEGIYYISTDSIQAFTQMRDILSDNPKINTVLCLDGFSSRTAASVIPAIDQDYYTVGFDISDYTVKALENGDMDLLVTQNYREMGRMAVEIALNYKQGDEAIELYQPCVLYTRENAGKLREEYLHGEG